FEKLVSLYPKTNYLKQLAGMYGELGKDNRRLAIFDSIYLNDELKKSGDILNLAYMFLGQDVPYKAAKIIAKGEKRVIVLDLDMRRSKLHELFKLPNKEGVSTLLAGKVSLKEVIQHTRDNNLHVITSGPTPPNPSELLMTDTFKRIIKILMAEYDYVLLDSPPIGLVTDAMIVMRMSDINIILLRAEYSRRDFLKNINHFVEEHELKAGIILNGVKASAKGAAYGFGYGFNYGYKNNYYS
ncbi:MAG: CpsD/CapB family tyrosine-protein kinase, partial [Hydrogenimonas sp.]|nr:CpsD/CapB family tyrosine-protein kinase [Hydrogenimonas sp.]